MPSARPFLLYEGYHGFGAVGWGGGDGEVAAVQTRYLTAQAQADAASVSLRGEEWLEQIRQHLRGNATAVVLDADVRTPSLTDTST